MRKYADNYRWVALFGWLIVASIIVAAAFFALREALDVPLSQADGAYQTASGLHRLAAGDRPGADFFPYLGVGLLYFLYPVFLLAGGTMGASVFAAFFMVWLATVFSVGLVAALLARRHRLWSGVLVAGAFSCGVTLLYPELHPVLVERVFPGNSLRPIRSLIPFIGALLMYPLLRAQLNLSAKAVLAGMISGLMFPWSNDYGVPAAATLGLFAMGWVWWQQRVIGWRPFLVPLVAIATAALLMTLGTAGSPLAMMGYNLGVSHDQNWYFPCWAYSCRIYGLDDLYRKFLQPAVGGWLWVIPGLALGAGLLRSRSLGLLLAVGLSLLLGAMLTASAGHIEHGYAAAYLFWARLVVYLAPLVVVLRLLDHFRLRWWLAAAPLVALANVAATLKPMWQHQQALQERQVSSDFVYSAELGGYLPDDWVPYLEQGLALGDRQIVEDYWGIWSAATRSFGATPTDSVIHALGPARQAFAEVMAERPDLVVTGAPSYLGYWSGWLLSSSWWFYEPLLSGYQQTLSSPGTRVWEPGPLRQWETVGCSVSNGQDPALTLEASEPGYYEVQLDYQTDFSRGTLLHARNNLNYAVDAEGYVSIDPRAEQWTYPVAMIRPGENRFGFRLTTRGDTLEQLDLQGCAARRIVVDAPQLLPEISAEPVDAPYPVTDDRWLNGMARWAPAFFVENTERNRTRLAPGSQVRFYDGTARRVTHQLENGPFVEIYLDGMHPLHGGLGFPHSFEVEAP